MSKEKNYLRFAKQYFVKAPGHGHAMHCIQLVQMIHSSNTVWYTMTIQWNIWCMNKRTLCLHWIIAKIFSKSLLIIVCQREGRKLFTFMFRIFQTHCILKFQPNHCTFKIQVNILFKSNALSVTSCDYF